MPQIQWKIDAGHILTIVLVIAALCVSWGNLGAKIDSHTLTLQEMKTDIVTLRGDVGKVREEQAMVRGELKQQELDRRDAAQRPAHLK